MTQSLAHPSAGSALGRKAGCQPWLWQELKLGAEQGSQCRTSESISALPSCSLLLLRWLSLTSPHRVRERGLQARPSKPAVSMVQREKEKHRMDGWSPVFPPERCLFLLMAFGSKARHSTRAGYIPQQPSCGHPSLSSNSLEAAPRLQALCNWLPDSFYKLCLYAVSFKSPYTFYCNKHNTARSGLSNGSVYFFVFVKSL